MIISWLKFQYKQRRIKSSSSIFFISCQFNTWIDIYVIFQFTDFIRLVTESIQWKQVRALSWLLRIVISIFLTHTPWFLMGYECIIRPYTVADLWGGTRDVHPPMGPKFFQFHAVFGKFWQNHMLAPPPGELHPLLGEILDPPLLYTRHSTDLSGRLH